MIRETSYTGARKKLAALMDQVTDTHEPVLALRIFKLAEAILRDPFEKGWREFIVCGTMDLTSTQRSR